MAFGNLGYLQQWNAQQQNPAVPAGVQQGARAAQGYRRQSGGFDLSWLGRTTAEQGYVDTAQQWYTGANRDGTNNGWSTAFQREFLSDQDEALKQGTMGEFFAPENKNTGVVMWDHTSEDGRTQYRFGDVFQRGKKVANIYDQFDTGAADLMMSQWLYTGDQLSDYLSDSDPTSRLRDQITETRAENKRTFPQAQQAAETRARFEAKEADYASGPEQALMTLGSALGGAATMAAAGFVVGGPVGAVVGGIGGGVSGGVGAWLNRDELTESAARASVMTEIAREQNGATQAGAFLQNWGSFAHEMTSPVTQLSHGLTELHGANEPGDRTPGFYRVDPRTGEADRPFWAKPLSLMATTADGLMQFVSPFNRAVYASQTLGAQVGGQVVQLGASGSLYDPREGGYDNIFVDDEGNPDPVSAAAGIFEVAIDAVQVLGLRGLSRQALAGREGVARNQPLGEFAGVRFVRDVETGEVKKKFTMAILAPSEQVAFANVKWKARVEAAKQGRAATSDDFFRAANSMANGSSKLKAAMVNGFGEGYEEFAQGALNPIAFDGELHPMELVDAFMYGAAGGVGMSLGATFAAPTSDARLKQQAFALETIRNGGVEPDAEAFDAMWNDPRTSHTQKRVLASRSKKDAELTSQSLQRLSENLSATLDASGLDVAWMIDARRSERERALLKGTLRTDTFTVQSGLVDAGRVGPTGELKGDTAPAESLHAGALTVNELLFQRWEGLQVQRDFLDRRIADNEGDPELADAVAQAQTLRADVDLALAVGEQILVDITNRVSEIYDERTTATQRDTLIDAMNTRLAQYYYRGRDVEALADRPEVSQEDLRQAAAHFITLLHSREPKLDTGSYLALLPHASKELTATRSENFLQVSIDVQNAINGDFDGDRLRAEHQLILTRERFAQARGGSNFGGASVDAKTGEPSIDVVAQDFDVQLTVDLSGALTDRASTLHDQAEATVKNVMSAIAYRYGSLMSPAAMRRVDAAFRTAIRKKDGRAGPALRNVLAAEAGEAIDNRGKEFLTNEWTWISQVVRANFSDFQTSIRMLRTSASVGPSNMLPVLDIDTPEGTNARKQRATTDAQTLALFADGNNLFRKFQKIHYSFWNSKVLREAGVQPADLDTLARFYAELSRGATQDEMSRVQGNDEISAQVLIMLSRLVDAAWRDPAIREALVSPANAMTVLANVKVKNAWFADGVATTDNTEVSIVQLLLGRVLDLEKEKHKATYDSDTKMQAKHNRLTPMTRPNRKKKDVNAERAFVEVFGAVPFADSLRGITGNLAPQTTPEQWMRRYVSLGPDERKAEERFYANVPEYLDRKDTTNLPYTLTEALKGEITPYRSMMDALMAVGRTELPRREEVGRAAIDDVKALHQIIREAALSYRNLVSTTGPKRAPTTELVQEMFNQNRAHGRLLLEMIPSTMAGAVSELKDGSTYIAPWIYKMFTFEKADEAVFYYFKMLALTQMNSILNQVHEDESDAEGRAYHRIQSRFQRLLYELAAEPGRLHLEKLVRQLDTMKSIEEFFDWLNTEPGYRRDGEQAPFIPFNDDVADFEADAGGGWTTVRASADLRSAIAEVRRSAETLRDEMSFRESRKATDDAIAEGIQRALDEDPAADDLDRANLRQMRLAVETVNTLPRAFAPNAMLALMRGAIRSFDPNSTDKGKSPTSYGPIGEMQALMDAFGFLPGTERTMETLGAHSISSLTTNIGDLAQHGGTAMDETGRQIKWEPLTVESALGYLRDPRTAPLGYVLLTPKALDINAVGGMSERLMTEASLEDLLDNSHYQRLFNLDGEGALDRAMTYLSLVDAKAQAEGGNFSLLRYAVSVAVARTSGQKGVIGDTRPLGQQAFIDVARAHQLIAQTQATPITRDSTLLTDVLDGSVQHLRNLDKSRRLPAFSDKDTGIVSADWVQMILDDLEIERMLKEDELTATITDADELDRAVAGNNAMYDLNEERIRGILSDNLVEQVISRFQMTGDPVADQVNRVQLLAYVKSKSSFPGRAPESAHLYREIVTLAADGRVPDDEFDWGQLSRSAMGVYLTDEMLRVATHVTVPPFFAGDPAESNARFFKFFDPAYTHLATDLLTDQASLAAGVWMYTRAEMPREILSSDTVIDGLKRTVLDKKYLGPWTPGLMSQQVEVQTRIDSAANAPAIAAAGNGPKRWAAISMATRASARRVPGEDLRTTISFNGALLAPASSLNNEIPVTPAGHTEATTMPVAMLDNRFYSGLRVNGDDVPLIRENTGYRWGGEEAETGYRYVSLPRLRTLIQRIADQQGVPIGALSIEVDFIHPESRPADPVWMNNVYFDGRSHTLLPDNSESLIGEFWSGNGGQVGKDTQRPLDASKNGVRAWAAFQRNPVAIAEAERLWTEGNDLAAMIRRKTEIVMSYDDGSGAIDPTYYNAVYKMVSLLHILVGTKDGATVAWTAEQVIAHQAANGRTDDFSSVMDNKKLRLLSPDVLRTMLGETGDQGIPGYFEEEYLLNPDMVKEYTHIKDHHIARFGAGWLAEEGGLIDTVLTNIGAQRVMKVHSVLTEAERSARIERIQYLTSAQVKIEQQRFRRMEKSDVRNNYAEVLKAAMVAINSERNTFNFPGLPIGPNDTYAIDHALRLLEGLQGVKSRDNYERGFRLRDEGGPSFPGGILTVQSLTDERKLEHHLALKDLVLFELNTFTRPGKDVNQIHKRLEQALDYVTRHGSTIVLGSGDGSRDERDFAARWLQEHGYARVAGSKYLYEPVEFTRETQNERAYASTLTETDRIQVNQQVITALAVRPIGTAENVAMVNPASTKLRSRIVLNNILPSSQYVDYNLPIEDNLDNGPYARALDRLREASRPGSEGRAALVAAAGKDPRRLMPIKDALDRFHSRITSTTSLVLEPGTELEVGDIIPFIGPDDRIILYRHGFKPPRAEEYRRLQDESGIKIALNTSESDPAITANTGTVRAADPRPGFGRTLTLDMPLQLYGDKVQLEWNGMKYVLVPVAGVAAKFANVPIFGNGTLADLWSDAASADAKEAYHGRIWNYRNALTFFQFDFTRDLTEFFFPGQGDNESQQVLTYTLLERLGKEQDIKISQPDANILAKSNVTIADLVGEFAAREAEAGVSNGWVDRLQSDTDPTSQIARAVVIYMMTHGAHLDNVLKSAGFSHPDAAQSPVTARRVPGLFADLIDMGVESALHRELIGRFDDQLTRLSNGAGWKLNPDWTVTVFSGGTAGAPTTRATPAMPRTYHGGGSTLTGPLLARGLVSSRMGQFQGQGFNTTANYDLAALYAGSNPVYEVTGTKSGKTYTVFDMDQKFTLQDQDDFRAFLMREYEGDLVAGHINEAQVDMAVANLVLGGTFNDVAEEMYSHGGRKFRNKLTQNMLPVQPWELYVQFLEEERGAGILKATAGVTHGQEDFPEAETYIWLHPEDLNYRQVTPEQAAAAPAGADKAPAGGQGRDSLDVWLQFGITRSAGDNPVLDGQAFDGTEPGAVSAHNALASAMSVGAITPHKPLKRSEKFDKSFSRGDGIYKFGVDGSDLWTMLTALPNSEDDSFAGWRREQPAETHHRKLARDEIVGLFHRLTTDGWVSTEGDPHAEYERVAIEILNRMNLYGSQIAMVDSWVRMRLGRPYALDENGNERGKINASDAIQAAKAILRNVKDGDLPTKGGNIPLIDLGHLTTIYMANLNRGDSAWTLRDFEDPSAGPANSWDTWVDTAFGTAWGSAQDGSKEPVQRFDQIYLLAMDGLMHGYQNATTSTRWLPVSSNTLVQNQLMDAETNRLYVSIAADENLLANDPTLFGASIASLDEIIGGQRIYAPGREGPDPNSDLGKQKRRVERWRAEDDIPSPRRTDMRGVRQGGQTFLGYSTTTSAFWRSMINIRAGNALFNIPLVISAPIEAFYRRTIDQMANLATGEALGALGATQSKLFDLIKDTSIGAVAEQFGVAPLFTPDEHHRFGLLVDALSTRVEFKAMVYQALMYQYPMIPGIGRVEKWLAAYAKFGARMQDPSWGMLPKDLARIYLRTAAGRIMADPTGENIYSIDRMIKGMTDNPRWLLDADLETHNLAIAAISNIRSVKPNILSMAFRGFIDPLAANGKPGVNSIGNILKMLTLFQNFWSNSVVAMTGLQAPADFAARWFDGRNKSKLMRRMQAALRGETFVPDETEFYDMSEAIESMDLADAFIRGGITHTALFTFGMLAGSLGLSGDDDEEKWRRREAELQGVPVAHDPSQIEADFRNKGSIYLNWLPWDMGRYFRVNPEDPNSDSLAQMNWVTRYFLSPVIGMERFFETGDFSEVIHGFGDALGSHPLINSQLWNEGMATVNELKMNADDSLENGDTQAGAHFLITAVGIMERMMMENAMVNMIYVGRDHYDRDPYKLPARNEVGELRTDVRGEPYQTNEALKQYVDEEGKVHEAYVDETPGGAVVRSLTENRFSLALVGSLWSGLTGGSFSDSGLWRRDMPVKVRKFELAPTKREDLEETFTASFLQAGGQPQVTEDEAAQIIKRWYEKRGIWWEADQVERQAKVMAANSGGVGLSLIDANGNETLTQEGARAVIEGLRQRAVTIGDPSLAGVYIDGPTRDRIRDEYSRDLVQEGVDLGMSKDQATWRMRRIMFGTNTTEGTPKLIDFIYTDQIPWNATVEYNQLNTTYIMGPDGRPWATGFTRDGLMGALGLKPVNRLYTSADTGLAQDMRGNTVDPIVGVNTGLRALEARPESWEIPSVQDEIRRAAKEITDAIKDLDFSPSQPYMNKSGTGYGYGGYSYGGYGYGGGYGGGGGGGYSGGGYADFEKMYALPNGVSPYGNNIPFINTTNPLLRRGDIRRERVWSERGRLKQWQ